MEWHYACNIHPTPLKHSKHRDRSPLFCSWSFSRGTHRSQSWKPSGLEVCTSSSWVVTKVCRVWACWAHVLRVEAPPCWKCRSCRYWLCNVTDGLDPRRLHVWIFRNEEEAVASWVRVRWNPSESSFVWHCLHEDAEVDSLVLSSSLVFDPRPYVRILPSSLSWRRSGHCSCLTREWRRYHHHLDPSLVCPSMIQRNEHRITVWVGWSWALKGCRTPTSSCFKKDRRLFKTSSSVPLSPFLYLQRPLFKKRTK